MIDYRQIIKAAKIFDDLGEQDKNALLNDGDICCLDKKEFLFHHGDPVANFYIVGSGSVQLFRTDTDGNEKTLEVLSALDVICDDKIYESDGVHQYSAIAINDIVVIKFPKIWLKETIKKNNNFALNLLTLTSHQVEMARIEAEHKTTMSTVQLVACFLQELCLAHNFNPTDFKLPYSKKLIASRLGIKMETFSRTLPKLKKLGIIINKSNVTITNPVLVEDEVCNHCSIGDGCRIRNYFRKKITN